MYGEGDLLAWFQENYPKHTKSKLNMGKCCIRWKKLDEVPLQLISELVSKTTPEEWIAQYEKNLKK